MIVACVFTLACEDIKNLAVNELWDVSGDVMSLILIGTNLAIVVQIVGSSDAKRKRIESEKLRTIFDKMITAEAQDREAMDAKWKEYVDDAPADSEVRLYEKMAQLVQQTTANGTVVVAQKQTLTGPEHLMKVCKKHNKKVHRVFLMIASRCGAEYHEGPLKELKRVKEKATKDYGKDFRKVVDVVRGTIEFKGPADNVTTFRKLFL